MFNVILEIYVHSCLCLIGAMVYHTVPASSFHLFICCADAVSCEENCKRQWDSWARSPSDRRPCRFGKILSHKARSKLTQQQSLWNNKVS